MYTCQVTFPDDVAIGWIPANGEEFGQRYFPVALEHIHPLNFSKLARLQLVRN